MSYLYHIVPPQMVGTNLVPLSTLRKLSPELADVAFRKYANRPEVPLQRIPPLDCMWNDAVFFTAIPPQTIAEAYESCGVRLMKRRFYRIDPRKIDPKKATVWLATSRSKEEEDFEPFNIYTLERYSTMPERTLAYYRKMMEENRRREILVFAYVPHILYRGEVDVSDAPIIEV